jgi:predicted AAA+ superfamily ATPase
MPHLRTRILEPLLKKSLGWSPITAVFGQRQVGKTTLLRSMAASTRSFDDASFSLEFEANSQSILETMKKPLFIDEVQKHPPIFDALKFSVDNTKRPGQFLITGSVRFAQRKPIRESLTGRTTLWELLPLTTSELYEKPFRELWRDWSGKSLPQMSSNWVKPSQLKHLYSSGGLPGICFLRSDNQRFNAFKNHVATLIERDLPLIRQSKISARQIFDLLQLLVAHQGQPLNFSSIARQVRMSSPSVKSLIDAFEGLFLIRRHGRGLFFEDHGVTHYLDPHSMSKLELAQLQWIFLELRAQVVYRAHEVQSFGEYHSRGGSFVPFVIQTRSGLTIAVTFDPLPYPSQKSLRGLRSLEAKKKGSFRGIALCLTTEPTQIDKQLYVLPYNSVA